jgi:hypothetical protein
VEKPSDVHGGFLKIRKALNGTMSPIFATAGCHGNDHVINR